MTTPLTGTSSSPPFLAVEFEFEFPANDDASCLNTQMSAAGEGGAGAFFDGGAAAATSADFAAMDFGGAACG